MPIDMEHFRTKLEAREKELLGERRTAEDDVHDTVTGDVEDALDLASSGEARDDAFSASDREFHELEEVHDALARIKAGTYGMCEACDKEIEPARLEAVPWTRFCAEDARKRDHFVSPGTL